MSKKEQKIKKFAKKTKKLKKTKIFSVWSDVLTRRIADHLIQEAEFHSTIESVIDSITNNCPNDKKIALKGYLKKHFGVSNNEKKLTEEFYKNRSLLRSYKENVLYDFDTRKTSVRDIALEQDDKEQSNKKYEEKREEYFGGSEKMYIREEKIKDIAEIYNRKNLAKKIIVKKLKDPKNAKLLRQLQNTLFPSYESILSDVNVVKNYKNSKIVEEYLRQFDEIIEKLDKEKSKELSDFIQKFLYTDLRNSEKKIKEFEDNIVKKLEGFLVKNDKTIENQFRKKISQQMPSIIFNIKNIQLNDLREIRKNEFKSLDNITISKDSKEPIVPDNVSTNHKTVLHFAATLGITKDIVDSTIDLCNDKNRVERANNKIKTNIDKTTIEITKKEVNQKTLEEKIIEKKKEIEPVKKKLEEIKKELKNKQDEWSKLDSKEKTKIAERNNLLTKKTTNSKTKKTNNIKNISTLNEEIKKIQQEMINYKKSIETIIVQEKQIENSFLVLDHIKNKLENEQKILKEEIATLKTQKEKMEKLSQHIKNSEYSYNDLISINNIDYNNYYSYQYNIDAKNRKILSNKCDEIDNRQTNYSNYLKKVEIANNAFNGKINEVSKTSNELFITQQKSEVSNNVSTSKEGINKVKNKNIKGK